MFNKAIMKAPSNEENKGKDLSLAIANRSAALMRLGHLQLALEDVEFALSSGYPTDMRFGGRRKVLFLITADCLKV